MRKAWRPALVLIVALASGAAAYHWRKHEQQAFVEDTRPIEAPAPAPSGPGLERAHAAGIDNALERWARQNAPAASK